MHDDTTHTRAVTTPREKRKVEGNDCAEVEVLSTSQWGMERATICMTEENTSAHTFQHRTAAAML